MSDNSRGPGWDAKYISKISKDFFGGLESFFIAHDWPERGQKMMTKVQSRVGQTYGSIDNFERHFSDKSEYGPIHKQILKEQPNIILSEFDWEPEIWGCDWYNSEEEANRFLRMTEPGVISLAVQKGRIVGAYQLTHIAGDISDFSKDKSETNLAFKAYRAWTFSAPPLVSDILPDSWADYQNENIHEMVLLKKSEAANLLKLSWEDTSLYVADPVEHTPSVWITSFWGWSPESWGCVGFTSEARPQTIIEKTESPFLMLIYVTENAKGDSKHKGKVVGFYELSHEVGRKQDYISPEQLNAPHHPKEKWVHSFKALRAWEIEDDFKPTIREFHPDLIKGKRQQAVSTWAEPLQAEQVERLKTLPRKEVQVYNRPKVITTDTTSSLGSGKVGGGNFRGRAYEVSEPITLDKQLYILELSGATQDFVEDVVDGQNIYKVGLSAWPAGRKATLNSALPRGKFSWSIRNSTEEDDHKPYASFKIAKAGEDAMKDYLAEKHKKHNDADPTRHLGGEFYLTDRASIDSAWAVGRQAALKAKGEADG